MRNLAEPTLRDILTAIEELSSDHRDLHQAVSIFATNVDRHFNEVDKHFEGMDRCFGDSDKRANEIEVCMGRMETRMATKEYLDDKIFALRADLLQMAKRDNKRFEILIEELVAEKSLKRSVADRILSLE